MWDINSGGGGKNKEGEEDEDEEFVLCSEESFSLVTRERYGAQGEELRDPKEEEEEEQGSEGTGQIKGRFHLPSLAKSLWQTSQESISSAVFCFGKVRTTKWKKAIE